jgi:hypothetical protein
MGYILGDFFSPNHLVTLLSVATSSSGHAKVKENEVWLEDCRKTVHTYVGMYTITFHVKKRNLAQLSRSTRAKVP